MTTHPPAPHASLFLLPPLHLFFSPPLQLCVFPVPRGSARVPPLLVPVVAPKRQLACLPAPPPPVLSCSLFFCLSHYLTSHPWHGKKKPPSFLQRLSLSHVLSPSHSVQAVPPSNAQALPTIWYHSVALYGRLWVAMTTADSTCFSIALSYSGWVHLFFSSYRR